MASDEKLSIFDTPEYRQTPAGGYYALPCPGCGVRFGTRGDVSDAFRRLAEEMGHPYWGDATICPECGYEHTFPGKDAYPIDAAYR